MTTEQTVREAKTRWARRRRRLIGYGQWQPFTDAEPVRQHVRAIQATGMSLANLSTAANVSGGTLDHLLYGGQGRPPAALIRIESAGKLLNYWPKLDDYVDGAVISAAGTARRLQALAVIGWPVQSIHRQLGFGNVKTIEHARIREHVTARLARAVRDLYRWASIGTAEDHGITPWIAVRCRNQAASHGWYGPAAWDDDSIDNPEALPDWTGHCGTDRGWWHHTLEHIPMCPRCQGAHETWLAERRHLAPAERLRQLGAARAAASNRGAILAADARELLRHGNDYERAADRLGVTRQHLQQELGRHPEPEADSDETQAEEDTEVTA
ncbi:hypothetical protein [Streptomyces sp. CBMA152]|uniref:hypothetical protein n=1 Tax=Streptomyces sp. CBMA152 TaxID=1896312 RepID=UPI0016607EB9|nr:hypothetical protein [Streptomyces sp. CBMA152]MBD0743514.1 hypothetical protein [Streptomyces sp. CBMA152]